VAGQAEDPLALALSTLAVLLATINVVGGFVVTDRMLLMFRAKPRAAAGAPAADPAAAAAKAEVRS
jgi:NAD(P) transhydrogenase subunit alpha